MTRIKTIIIIIVTTMISACSEQPDCCDNVISNGYQAKLIDSNGINLLDPESPGAIDISKIQQYIVENGNTRMVDNTVQGYIADNPYGVKPIMIEEEHAVHFSFLYHGDDTETISIIRWNEEKTNTIICKFNIPGYPSYLTQVSQSPDVWHLEEENDPITITLKY
jgi:hypothetical protein